MRILRYKDIVIKENASDIVEKEKIISTLQKSLMDFNKIEEMDIEDIQDLIYSLENMNDLPLVLKKQMTNSLKLFMNDEFKKEYKEFLNYSLDILERYSVEDFENDEGIKNRNIKLNNLMSNILNMSKEELEEITQKFIIGSNKYKESKEKSVRLISEDPFGEENWDDITEEDRLKQSFEKYNNSFKKNKNYYKKYL